MSNTEIMEFILASLATISIIAIVYYVLLVIAQWKIFTKAGEAGWKSIIPILNGHVLYRICWKPAMFWICVVATILATIFNGMQNSLPAAIIALILYLVVAVIMIIRYFKLSKAFGHGAGFALGLILLNPIFMLILGFGSSTYVAND